MIGSLIIICDDNPQSLTHQVGNPELENKVWGRPQDMTIDRPCYAITSKSPGTDLAAETAAALAATAEVYMNTGASSGNYT